MAREKQKAKKLESAPSKVARLTKKPAAKKFALERSLVTSKDAVPKKQPIGQPYKRPHKWRSGTVALRQVRKEQKLLSHRVFASRKAPFQRLVRQVLQEITPDPVQLSAECLDMLQTAAEHKLISIIDKAAGNSTFYGRKMLRGEDIMHAMRTGVN